MYTTFLFDPTQLNLVSPVPVVVPMNSHQLHNHLPTKFGANAPLTIAACFEDLAALTQQRMLANNREKLEIPVDLAERTSSNGKFRLTAQSWRVTVAAGQLCLRMVTIRGAKSSIINTWVFPSDPCNLPVLAAELIGVGDAVRVAFVDIQAPIVNARTELLNERLKALAVNFADLPCDEIAPDWATEASLGHYTYARNVAAEQLKQIHACYVDYLDLYLDYAGDVRAQRDAAALVAARDTLHAYQLHHMQHSPGKKFLSNLFGSEWTERFMLDFLFTLP